MHPRPTTLVRKQRGLSTWGVSVYGLQALGKPALVDGYDVLGAPRRHPIEVCEEMVRERAARGIQISFTGHAFSKIRARFLENPTRSTMRPSDLVESTTSNRCRSSSLASRSEANGEADKKSRRKLSHRAVRGARVVRVFDESVPCFFHRHKVVR